MTVTVKQRKVSELRPHPRNPRFITEARFERLKQSLAGEPDMLRARPVVALPDGTVIAGNMRLRAAQALGWTQIPTVTIDLDEQRAILWALRDNNEYGEWDDDALAELLYELKEADVDLALAGFDDDAIARLLGSVSGDDVPPAEWQKPAEVAAYRCPSCGYEWNGQPR